jgi:prolyl-tRNA synthetase
MRWSQSFIPTLREAPADAEIASHIYLLRAGYVRQLAAGIYDYLTLGQRSLLKIMRIVREEMDTIGQEFFLPALHPAELWQASGRWQVMGDNMFRLKDRFDRDLCLGMTHEEVMADIARRELRSYKQLPQIWYQIQTKFRDEPRPRSGLLRVRQFIMKDSYSFDLDEAGLDASYRRHHDAYCRIFDRCGLQYAIVEAHSGAMGGSQSHEFMVMSDAGEDMVARCPACGYAANLEKAAARVAPVEDEAPAGPGPDEIATPNRRTIAEVSEFLGVPESRLLKSLLYMVQPATVPSGGTGATGQEALTPLLVLLRGDDEVNESKLGTALGGAEFRPAHPQEIEEHTGAPAGSVGPLGLRRAVRVFTDVTLRGRRAMIAGANRDGFHRRNITPGTDYDTEWVDVRSVRSGDFCAACGGALEVSKAIEVGHIFKLGRKYTQTLGVRVSDAQGAEVVPIMGSYGIGIERILTSAIEQNHDDQGFWLPSQIAPFSVIVTAVNWADTAIRERSEALYAELRAAGHDVLLDDRDERPGVKFKDADLIGVPFRINVGKKAAAGMGEFVRRGDRSMKEVPLSDILPQLPVNA